MKTSLLMMSALLFSTSIFAKEFDLSKSPVVDSACVKRVDEMKASKSNGSFTVRNGVFKEVKAAPTKELLALAKWAVKKIEPYMNTNELSNRNNELAIDGYFAYRGKGETKSFTGLV